MGLFLGAEIPLGKGKAKIGTGKAQIGRILDFSKWHIRKKGKKKGFFGKNRRKNLERKRASENFVRCLPGGRLKIGVISHFFGWHTKFQKKF